MELQTIHCFMVHPAKGVSEPPAIGGATVCTEDRLFQRFKGLFDQAEQECRTEITFIQTAEGKQQNVCRDLLLAYILSHAVEDARSIARRLQAVTTRKSGLGLLCLMLGKNEEGAKLVLSRFPAGLSIEANGHPDVLTAESLERTLVSSASYHDYKAAVFAGKPANGDFWMGWAIDNQMDAPETPPADYWIRHFLASDLRTTPVAGALVRHTEPGTRRRRAERFLRANLDRCRSLLENGRDELGEIDDGELAQAALRAYEERFRAVFASAPLGIAIYGPDGRYLQVNRAYCEMLGRTESDLLALGPMEVTHPEDRAEGERMLAEVRAGRRDGYAREKRFLHRDGRIVTAHLCVAAIRSIAGVAPLVVSMALDVTESRRLERDLLQVSARERRRLGYDLHDGLGPYLTGIAMKAKCLEEALRDASPEHASSASELCRWINHATAQARAIGQGLDPVQVEIGGLVPALQKLAEDSSDLFSLCCQFHCAAPKLRLGPKPSMHLYRIAQEAINNAAKYAQARRVDVALTLDSEGLCLSVQDDGVGLPAGAGESDGMGLRTMRFRANAIGATLSWESQPGQGVKIVCRLPASRLEQNHLTST